MNLLYLKQKLYRATKLYAAITGVSIIFLTMVPALPIYAYSQCGSGSTGNGVNDTAYDPVIDIGCTGKIKNPILDMAFALIRDISDGVGLIIVGSLVFAGIQYSSSRGDPQATAKSVTRIKSTVTALLIYIFGFAFLNYLIPGGFLHS